MESNYMAQTVMESLVGLNYTLRPLVYQMKEEQKEELMDVAEQGKVLLYGIFVAVDEIVQIAEGTIVKYAKEQSLEKKAAGKNAKEQPMEEKTAGKEEKNKKE